VSESKMSPASHTTAPVNGRPARLVFTRKGQFLKTLRARVSDHFGDRKRSDDPRLYRKALLIAAWFTVSYVLLLMARSGPAQCFLCVSYALAFCTLGFNVFHDANHGSFSSRKRVNLVLAWLSSIILGPSRYFWWHKHNIFHHAFTNVYQWDDDIETGGHLRMSSRQPWEPKFRGQHLYFAFLYAFATIEWFFVRDFRHYFALKMRYQPLPPMSRSEKAEFWACKGLYAALFVALPFVFHPAARVITGLLLFHAITGLTMTLIFQLAHETETVEFPVPAGGDPAIIEDEWAAHQMRTTANFATGNRLVNWFSGGLNFQIEHHLFPHISHTYYPEISGIVRRTAAEFGLPYNLHETCIKAVKSHYRFVRELGKEPSSEACMIGTALSS
jgi:linoleoyl-CoA desaturase